jgi:DNA-binding NtrC family response regulator
MGNTLLVSESTAALADLFSGFCTTGWEYGGWDTWTIERLRDSAADLLLLVGVPEPVRAVALLRQLEGSGVRARIVAILPRGLESDELMLVSRVADDFVLLPERAEVIRHRLMRFLLPDMEAQNAYENLVVALGKTNLVGQAPSFLRMAEKIVPSSSSDFPALITGETGTGKDLFARAIHFLSRRRGHPFIPVDCAGIPDHLFENELFGHARGAYTDAHGEQKGLAALADKGTLFLDEIDSLSLAAQAKLLRFLQDHQFKPLGSERYAHSDVRVIAATNRNLELHVAEKQFRSDLYFRLNVLRFELPPLCQRAQDIPLLARHFLALYQPPGVHMTFTASALHRLNQYHWPGNIRELANVVQRSIVFSQGTQINRCDIAIPEAAAPQKPGPFNTERKQVLRSFERDYVEELLRRNQGNITWAAREAGKERRAFGRLVKKYAAQPTRPVGQF